MAYERKLGDQINEVISKNLYLEAYSRREIIKFFPSSKKKRRTSKKY